MESNTNNHPMRYTFNSLFRDGRYFTISGDREVMCQYYEKVADFTESEIQIILRDLDDVKTKLGKARERLNALTNID